MTDFLAFYSDPDNAEERRSIRQLLRCTEAEATIIQCLGDLTRSFDQLANEVLAMQPLEMLDLPDEEEE